MSQKSETPSLPSTASQNGRDLHEGSTNVSLRAEGNVVNLDRSPQVRIQIVAQRYGVTIPAPLVELLTIKFGSDVSIDAITSVGNAGHLPQYVQTGLIEAVTRNIVQRRLMRRAA